MTISDVIIGAGVFTAGVITGVVLKEQNLVSTADIQNGARKMLEKAGFATPKEQPNYPARTH